MNSLKTMRQGWEAVEAEEIRLLQQLTPQEGLRQYLALQSEFEPQLQAAELFFRQERNEALVQLQARLLKLNQLKGKRMDQLIASLVRFQTHLEQMGIPAMVIEGLAVSVWGEPRLTRDVDVKILAHRDERVRVLKLLAEYTPLNADPDTAFRQNGIAFFQDKDGTRIDVMLAETSFDETAIGRSKHIEINPGQPVRVCTAEDLVIYKLLSLRTRDRLDVEGIVKRQQDKLDDHYIEKWLREFEQALDDSTLVTEYRRLRKQFAKFR